MSGITVKALDAAGGAQLAGGQSFFRVDGQPVVLRGDPVTPHGAPPHLAPVMTGGSPVFRIGGVPVIRAGDVATCGHPTSGRGFFSIP